MLADPVLEERARGIGKILRCLVCQNQSIDDSNADLARDLRVLVRRRLVAGDSDEQAVKFIVDRYGDFVLLKPPLRSDTLLLWFGPALLLGIGLALAWFYIARVRRAGATASPLSAAEEERVQRLLDEDAGNR